MADDFQTALDNTVEGSKRQTLLQARLAADQGRIALWVAFASLAVAALSLIVAVIALTSA